MGPQWQVKLQDSLYTCSLALETLGGRDGGRGRGVLGGGGGGVLRGTPIRTETLIKYTLYLGALCPRLGMGSHGTEMSIIIISLGNLFLFLIKFPKACTGILYIGALCPRLGMGS